MWIYSTTSCFIRIVQKVDLQLEIPFCVIFLIKNKVVPLGFFQILIKNHYFWIFPTTSCFIRIVQKVNFTTWNAILFHFFGISMESGHPNFPCLICLSLIFLTHSNAFQNISDKYKIQGNSNIIHSKWSQMHVKFFETHSKFSLL